MANDFNNILQVIGGHAEVLLQGLGTDDPRAEAVRSIAEAARKATELTRHLQAMDRRQTRAATPLDLSALVRHTIPELRRHLHPRVQVVTHLAARLPFVQVDREQLQQVLMSLVENAADAMPEGGTLRIVSDSLIVGPSMRRLRPWLRAGRFVRLEIADSGHGPDRHSMSHFFEPFYKPTPRYLGGLALSAVYRTVKQNDGFIWVDSESGQGSRISILLPSVSGSVEDDVEDLSRGRVLLVEDDENVRELLDGVLMHHGYSVTSCGSAEDALGHGGPFDLLLTDIGLPGLSGSALATEITRRQPGLPVLLMSGEVAHVTSDAEPSAHGFLKKPFSSQALLASVEGLLSA